MSGVAALADAKASEVLASFARQRLMQTIGAELTTHAPGRCAITLPFNEAVGQQGVFHSGVVLAVAHTAGRYAALTLLPLGSEALTLQYRINMMRPAAGYRILAEGMVLRPGQSVCMTRVDVFVEHAGQRTLCAALQQNILRVPGPKEVS